jgi:hypothetical protein
MDNVTNMYDQDEQSQLNNMGFDKGTLNQANQNIAQETGQLGAANNQMATQGGTMGFNAVGMENKQAGIQNQANNAIAANTTVQSNELGQANAAATYTGQKIGAQQTSQSNAISVYNNAATQSNSLMANYATSLNTMSQQAVAQGGLVGSNLANIMASAKSAADAALDKYNAQLDVAQENQANAQAGLIVANTALTNQQVAYNKQLEPLQTAAQKLITANNVQVNKQIANLQDTINNETSTVSAEQNGINSGGGWLSFLNPILGPIYLSGQKDHIANDTTQLTSLENQYGSDLNSQLAGAK